MCYENCLNSLDCFGKNKKKQTKKNEISSMDNFSA